MSAFITLTMTKGHRPNEEDRRTLVNTDKIKFIVPNVSDKTGSVIFWHDESKSQFEVEENIDEIKELINNSNK